MESEFEYICIKAGYGYWDITVFPYGGDFKRAPQASNLPFKMTDVKAITPYIPKPHETEIELNNGKRFVVKNEFILYVRN